MFPSYNSSMSSKKKLFFILKAALFLLYFLALFVKNSSSFPAESIQSKASPYFFSIPSWEIKHIFSDSWIALRYGSRLTTESEDTGLVNRYENLRDEIDRLKRT